MSESKRNRFDIRQAGKPILIGLGVLLALNIVFFLIAVRPKVREAGLLSQANNPRVQGLRDKQERVQRLESFVEAMHRAVDDLRTLREDMLSTRQARMVEVQAEVADLCAQFGIDLEQVTYEHDRLETEQLDVLRMIVPLKGGYADLRKFLQAVEGSPKFLVVERIVLGQGKEGGVMLQLNITLATYFNARPEASTPRRVASASLGRN